MVVSPNQKAIMKSRFGKKIKSLSAKVGAKPTKRPGSKMASMSAKIKSMGPKLMAGIGPKSRPMTGPKTMPARKMLLGGRKPSTMAGKAKRR